MICPLCESPAPDDARVCGSCGKQLLEELQPEAGEELVPGFVATQVGGEDLDGAFALAAHATGEIAQQQLEGLELTALEARGPTQLFWRDEPLPLDSGRAEQPIELRPERPVAVVSASSETMLCPACHCRVPLGERCVKCRVPLVRAVL